MEATCEVQLGWMWPRVLRPDVGELLSNAAGGDERSMAELLPLVYAELKALAGSYLNRHRDGGGRSHTLQPTALVHEAYLKMLGAEKKSGGWGREHFLAVAATAMRQVLVDHARRKGAEKRGGGHAGERVSISGVAGGESVTREVQILELHELLAELALLNARAARVAEMRLFGGMMPEQMALVIGVSRMTVDRDWELARAWLAGKMTETRDE
ncbi:MAG: RNA polymerase subunit sigma-70 [Phycisphaerae bacterium]|nr:RNA polymerase subunit sigma-70 [Phycisphaerae bacterium]